MSGDTAVSILLVEDNPDHALLTKLAIGHLDEVREVRVADDGFNALELLRHGVRPDLILLDLKLPGLNGFDVLEALRSDASLRAIPVVVLSTSSADADRSRVATLGALGYLDKPVDVDALRRLLDDGARSASP